MAIRSFIEFVHRLCLVLALTIFGGAVSCAKESNPENVGQARLDVDITVTVLGSGTPIPSQSQFGSAILIEAGGQYFMFDCGRGCTTRLAQLNPKLIPLVNHLFITHMHSDHLMGIDDLWLNGWVNGRTVSLRTWGPVGTKDMMQGLRETFRRDIAFRHADNVPAPSAALDDAFTDLSPQGGLIYNEHGIKVSAFRVDHASITPAYGYKLEYNRRTVVISGDTTKTASLYEQGMGADVLMLEVISPAMVHYLDTVFGEEQKKTVLSYHLTTEQAADIFAKTGPRLGVYYHTANTGKSRQSLIDATKALYDGRFVVSHDLMQISIGETITVHDVTQND